ncbi:MAG: hypothetical protein GQ561_01450 [Calditrichae bacterium]|jgi:hypothetical protein|nr:hypothetical protein [Calditrichia bacterium]NOQ96807.1 hypothetical protein [Calditrichia bacterium]
MVKVITLKHIEPKEALRLVQESGIIPYLINWGCNIDEKNRRLVFQLKHGGGGFEDEVKNAASDLESYLKSIDVNS